MFDGLVAQLKELLPDLGRHLAVDSKALQSHAEGAKIQLPAAIRRPTGESRKNRAGAPTAACGRRSRVGLAISCTCW